MTYVHSTLTGTTILCLAHHKKKAGKRLAGITTPTTLRRCHLLPFHSVTTLPCSRYVVTLSAVAKSNATTTEGSGMFHPLADRDSVTEWKTTEEQWANLKAGDACSKLGIEFRWTVYAFPFFWPHDKNNKPG